jgi:hypothetical protein
MQQMPGWNDPPAAAPEDGKAGCDEGEEDGYSQGTKHWVDLSRSSDVQQLFARYIGSTHFEV